jgi:hypothetical protein
MAGSSGIGGIFTGIGSLGKDLFGEDTDISGTKSGTTTTDTTQTERLKLDEAAIQKIIEDVLGGAEGLAGIFSKEQAAGVFDSSVAAQAAGDLASKLVGELAKLTAEKEVTQTGTQVTKSQEQQAQEQGGLIEGPLKKLGGLFGF